MLEVIINDANYLQFVAPPSGQGMGLVSRDFDTHPVGYCASARAFDLPLTPDNEWQDRLDALIAAKSQLSDVRMTGMDGAMMPSRDQGKMPYCWCHSVVSAALLVRAFNGQPYADLSPFGIGCMIKNFRNQGGWNQEAMDYLFARGCPTSKTWKQQSMSRSNDNAATWDEAKKYSGIEGMDLDPQQMKQQLITCLLLNIPVAIDLDWWGHSVCATDLVSLSPFRIRIWNSWGENWSDNGMGILEGSRAIPNGATALRVVSAAA